MLLKRQKNRAQEKRKIKKESNGVLNMLKWFVNLFKEEDITFKIDKETSTNIDATKNDEQSIDDEIDTINKNSNFIWCLVGNVVEKHLCGESREIKIGTKHFSPNTKVYCFPPLWGDGYEDIKVIGHPRHRKSLITIVMKSKYINNWRIQKVYNPFVIKKMIEHEGWDNTDESRKRVTTLLNSLLKRNGVIIE